MKIGVISPQDWGLKVREEATESMIEGIGAPAAELEERARRCTYHWASHNFDDEIGAFYGFYRAREQTFEPPQTVNLIAPWQLLAAYDRYGDESLLINARRAADWFYGRFVMSHPMSVVIGGVFESLGSGELWTKFTAEFVILNLGLFQRTGDALFLHRARQSAGFLLQSGRYNYAPRYDMRRGRWLQGGWQSFGRVVEALLLLQEATGEPQWRTEAVKWSEFGLTLLAEDGGLYLIDDDYFNTDIAADELRAFSFMYELQERRDFLDAAEAFGGWLIRRQRADGAWPLTIDRDGNIVVPTVGPGDMPNIAIAFLRLHAVTRRKRYLQAAHRAFAYSLRMQALPTGHHPYVQDPVVQWGFWSWDPYYDYTLSGDQVTHHLRGMLFALDYLPRSG